MQSSNTKDVNLKYFLLLIISQIFLTFSEKKMSFQDTLAGDDKCYYHKEKVHIGCKDFSFAQMICTLSLTW